MKTNWKEMAVVVTIVLMVTITAICSFIAAYNSDNSREYYLIEKVDELQLQLNNIEQHINYMEIQLEENLIELD